MSANFDEVRCRRLHHQDERPAKPDDDPPKFGAPALNRIVPARFRYAPLFQPWEFARFSPRHRRLHDLLPRRTVFPSDLSMKIFRSLFLLACGLSTVTPARAVTNVARLCNERALAAIRTDTPHPPAQ